MTDEERGSGRHAKRTGMAQHTRASMREAELALTDHRRRTLAGETGLSALLGAPPAENASTVKEVASLIDEVVARAEVAREQLAVLDAALAAARARPVSP